MSFLSVISDWSLFLGEKLKQKKKKKETELLIVSDIKINLKYNLFILFSTVYFRAQWFAPHRQQLILMLIGNETY